MSDEESGRGRGRRRSRTFSEQELEADLGGPPLGAGSTPGAVSASPGPSASPSGSASGVDPRRVPVSTRTRDILELRDYRARDKGGDVLSGSDEEEDELLRLEAEEERARRKAGAAAKSPRKGPPAKGAGKEGEDGGEAGERPPIKLKLLLLGDGGVGKTSLLQRYSKDKFDPDMLATAGVAFQTEHLTIAGRRVRCDIWDTAGQERFHVITRAYYAKSHGIVLVYDASEPDATSFKNIQYWMDNIRKHASAGVAKVIIGNKVDREDKVVSTEEGEAAAREYDVPFFEASAKTGKNVTDAFYTVAKEALRAVLEERGEDVSAHLGDESAEGAAAGGGSSGRRRRCVIA